MPRAGSPSASAVVQHQLDKVASSIEHATVLDKPAEAIAGLVPKVIPPGPAQDLASGTALGHPLHPVLIAVPIGSWLSATFLDLTGGDAKAAQRLVLFGNLAALPTAVTGANDWAATTGGERRVGLVHALLSYAALGLYTGSWLARRRGRRVKGASLALVGAGVIGVSGWLGGHLSYGIGVGVDTTAFTELPAEWTDVAGALDVPDGRAIAVEAAGVPVLLTKYEGRIVAMADRCTHRGGPLHEGKLRDGCVVCPWHGSAFALADGTVQSGPAVRPQPVVEVQVVDSRVQVRRGDEVRSLRTEPAGH